MAVVHPATITPTKPEFLGAWLGGQLEVLGTYRYDGTTDPVALGCFERALRGEQEQAAVEIWQDGAVVEVREPTATLSREPGTGSSLAITQELAPAEPSEGACLIATPATASVRCRAIRCWFHQPLLEGSPISTR